MVHSSCDSSRQEAALRLRKRVFERKPILSAIIEKLGQKSLLEYVRGYTPIEIHPLMAARKPEFLQTFEREIREMFPEDMTQKAVRQMSRHYYASTNDHHGPINAFDAFNAHLILALAAMEDQSPDRTEAIILLSCSNVSLNNISFPRGILFSTPSPEGIVARRLALLPSKSNPCSLYGYRAYAKQDVDKLLTLLRENVRDGFLSQAPAQKLEIVIRDILGDPAILERKTYSAQASMINSRLWNAVFQGADNVPILVSIGKERLTARLLLDHHLGHDTLLTRLLFQPDYEKVVFRHFDGIYGAFSSIDQSGTYFFWGRDAVTGKRSRLLRQGDDIVSDDGLMVIPWNAESIAAALQSRRIIPSMLCVFCTISFYYGVKCLGGYSQVNYLTFMKQAFVAILKELGELEAAEACDPVATKHWSGFSFAYASAGKGPVIPAQFLDLYLYADPGMWTRLMDYAHVCTLAEAVEPILPEIYRYSYPADEREKDLLSVTPQELTAFVGLRPCIRVI